MIAVTVDIRSNHFPGMGGRLVRLDRDIRQKGAFDMGAAADPLTPVLTGALRGNKTMDENGVWWHMGYAGHQNYGTSRGVPARHFADQAYAVVVPSMLDAYRSMEGRLV